METPGILSKIEFFQNVDSIDETIKENETTITDHERLFLLRLNIYFLNELKYLAEKITDLFSLNYKSLFPVEDEKLIDVINKGFSNIPQTENVSFKEQIFFNTYFRIGVIDGIKEALEKHKNEKYNLALDIVYDWPIKDVDSLSTLNTIAKRNIIEGFYPKESDPVKLQKHLKNRLKELKDKYVFKDFQPIQLTGFSCNLPPETVKEIFNFMAKELYLSGQLIDFQTIFSNKPTPVKNPVNWLLEHNKRPNKTALFTFIKLMLGLDELPREILRQANKLFRSGKENIFPDGYTYPREEEQHSSTVKHFKPVKEIIKKTRPE